MRKTLLAAAVSGLLVPASPLAASAACDTLKTVRASGGDYTAIQPALDDIPAVLTGDYCVDIQDDGPYNEFYVREKDANGHHITIGALDGTHKPTIVASSSPVAYVGTLVSVESSSVTIMNLGVYDAPIEAVNVSSSYVTLDGIYARFSAPDQVSDGAFALTGGWTTVIRSSADVTGGRGVALKMTGTGTTVSYSTFTSDSQDVVRFGSEIRPSVDYVSGSTNTVTRCRIATTGTNGVHFGAGSTGNTLSDSTVTVNACHLCFGALLSNGADNSVLSGDYIENGISADTVRSFTLRLSSVIVTGSGDPALALGNAPDFSIVSSVLYSTAAAGAVLASVSGTISYSTITSDGAFGGWALSATDAHPLTITRSYVRGPGGIDIDGSITEGMTLSNSVVVSTEIAGIAIQEINGSIFTLSTVTSGGALSWDGSGQAVVRNLLFKGFPSSDLTAFTLPDAVVTATFTGVGFEDPLIGVNVDASGLSPGNLAASRLTFRDSYGPESGPSRENDPGHVVDWVGVALSTPVKPSTPAGAGLDSSSIRWTWPKVARAWTYNVYDAATRNLLGSVETTFYIETPLAASRPYGVVVAAANGAGQSPLSSPATTYTFAAPPTDLAVEAVNVTSVTLSWSTAGNGAGTRYLVGHWVIRGSTSVATVTQVGTGISTGTAVTGLLPNTTYHFNLRAENKLGKITAYVPAVEVSTKTDAAKPAAISGFKAAGADAGSVLFTWKAQSSGAAEADDYLFSPSTGGVFQASANSFTLYTAGPNAPVSGKVRARNVTGLGPLSSAATGYSLAAAPTGLAAAAVNVTSITVTWNVNGNPDGTKYLLSRWVAGKSTSTVIVAKTAAQIALGVPILGLTANTTYQINVRAENVQLAATAYDPAVEISTKTRRSASVAALAATAVQPLRGWPYSGRALKLAAAGPSAFRPGAARPVALKTGSSVATTGTVLAVSLPQAVSGAGRLKIYTRAAVLVRDLDLGELKGGFDYYLDWDGFGADGAEAAPGAYYAILTIGGKQNASVKLTVAPPPKKSPAPPR